MLPVVDRAADLPLSLDPAILLIDKPAGPTSFSVVRAVRRATGVKKVGHAGTLDPMATGLLIVLVGRPATREQDRFMGMNKVYAGTIRLGETTASYDAETPIIEQKDASSISDAELDAARRSFLGEIEQIPPMYSAIKVDGKRLYKSARRGDEVERQPRRVRIDRFDLLETRGADLDFEIACSKGTYIRSIAHDLGELLGVGAHLVSLRRLAIGEYSVEDALDLNSFVERMEARADA